MHAVWIKGWCFSLTYTWNPVLDFRLTGSFFNRSLVFTKSNVEIKSALGSTAAQFLLFKVSWGIQDSAATCWFVFKFAVVLFVSSCFPLSAFRLSFCFSNSLFESLTERESWCGSGYGRMNEHNELNRAAHCHAAVSGCEMNSPWLPASDDVKSWVRVKLWDVWCGEDDWEQTDT